MGVTLSLRAQTGLCSHFSWSSCPGVGVCGDSHTCLRVFLEVQRAHLLGLFLLVPGQAFPVPQLAWGGDGGATGTDTFPHSSTRWASRPYPSLVLATPEQGLRYDA